MAIHSSTDVVVPTCPKCGGTGEFVFPSGKTGECFACIGKGHQTQGDVNRNKGYWGHQRTLASVVAKKAEPAKPSVEHLDPIERQEASQ